MSLIRELWGYGWQGRALLAVFAAVPVILALAAYASIQVGLRCDNAGGHLVSKRSYGDGQDGGMAALPSTVSYCVSADGRVLF